MKISFVNRIRIIIVVFLVFAVIIVNYKFVKIESSIEKEFIRSEFSFKVDSIERLSRQVLIHVYESDSSFYAPYLLLYDFTNHQDSVVKKKNVNGFYIYKFEYDYKLHVFIKGYD